METKVTGTILPVLEIDLQPGEAMVAEGGELSWMTPSISMRTTTNAAGGGGMFGAIKRAASGSTIFLTEYRAEHSPGQVAFATKLPGQILEVKLDGSTTFMVQRHGFLCATPGVQLAMGFQKKMRSGIFGGEGFILQALEESAQYAGLQAGGEALFEP